MITDNLAGGSSPRVKAPSVERFAVAAERCPIEDVCPPQSQGCAGRKLYSRPMSMAIKHPTNQESKINIDNQLSNITLLTVLEDISYEGMDS